MSDPDLEFVRLNEENHAAPNLKYKNMNKIVTPHYRQGDLLIEHIAKTDHKLKRSKTGKIILAEGEATGHHHVLECEELESWQDSEETIVRVATGATITHEEHSVITLSEGIYRVRRQREYSPKEIRRVQD